MDDSLTPFGGDVAPFAFTLVSILLVRHYSQISFALVPPPVVFVPVVLNVEVIGGADGTELSSIGLYGTWIAFGCTALPLI